MAPAQGWHAQIEKCKHLYLYYTYNSKTRKQRNYGIMIISMSMIMIGPLIEFARLKEAYRRPQGTDICIY